MCDAIQANLQEQISPADTEVILGQLPERIRVALIKRAAEIEYPIEAVIEMAIEMAIASFFDTEALGFADCEPGRDNKAVIAPTTVVNAKSHSSKSHLTVARCIVVTDLSYFQGNSDYSGSALVYP